MFHLIVGDVVGGVVFEIQFYVGLCGVREMYLQVVIGSGWVSFTQTLPVFVVFTTFLEFLKSTLPSCFLHVTYHL